MGLLTPVIKGVLTDNGFANTVMAQQMFGGHGYIAEHGMEQFVRDARITHDLRRRQRHPGARPGRAQARQATAAARIMAFFNEVQTYLKEHSGRRGDEAYLEPLGESLGHLQQATMWFMQNAMAKPDNAGAGSNDYMHLFGLVALGYMWCADREGRACQAAEGERLGRAL